MNIRKYINKFQYIIGIYPFFYSMETTIEECGDDVLHINCDITFIDGSRQAILEDFFTEYRMIMRTGGMSY